MAYLIKKLPFFQLRLRDASTVVQNDKCAEDLFDPLFYYTKYLAILKFLRELVD